MNTRRCLIAFAFAAVVPAQRPAESATMPELCHDLAERDSRKWSAAMTELVERGGKAVPELRRIITRAEEPMGNAAKRAAQVLHRIGAAATPAMPDLLRLVNRLGPRADGRSSVILAIGELVPHAPTYRNVVRETMFDLLAQERLDGISRLLQTADFFDKCRVIARTEFGPETDADEIGKRLTDHNPFVREFAAELLATKTTASETTIKALLQAIRVRHPDKFQLEGFPPLEIFLDRRIQAAAARALLELAPKDPRSVAAFSLLFERPDHAERLAAVFAARQAGAAAKALLPQLMRMAENDAPLVRREAITTLGTLGQVAAPAVDLLQRLTDDPDPQISKRAQTALRQVRK